MLSVDGEHQLEKLARDQVALMFVSVAPQTFNRDTLQRRPSERRIPLVAAVGGAGLNTARLVEERKVAGHLIRLLLGGDARPKRIEGGQERVRPHLRTCKI